MFDFGALPPEVNSTRMYAGPGSGPMMAAASAWDGLAAQLEMFATHYSAAISELQGQSWSGPSSTAMVAASAPYISWVTATSQQAEQAANQARAAAAAYESAFLATVPPVVVAANRALLAMLLATNFFGQNTPAIAATEAAYAEMWAQDATAMYGYAASAAAASALSPFDEPPATTNPAAVDPSASPIIAAFETFNTLTGPLVPAYQIPFATFQAGNFFTGLAQLNIEAQTLPELAAPLQGAAARTVTPAMGSRPVLAQMGRAGSIGGLSTPASWTQAAPGSVAVVAASVGQPGSRVLPPWVHEPAPIGHSGVPAMAQLNNAGARRGDNTVFRMRDRRYHMPRPAPGG